MFLYAEIACSHFHVTMDSVAFTVSQDVTIDSVAFTVSRGLFYESPSPLSVAVGPRPLTSSPLVPEPNTNGP